MVNRLSMSRGTFALTFHSAASSTSNSKPCSINSFPEVDRRSAREDLRGSARTPPPQAPLPAIWCQAAMRLPHPLRLGPLSSGEARPWARSLQRESRQRSNPTGPPPLPRPWRCAGMPPAWPGGPRRSIRRLHWVKAEPGDTREAGLAGRPATANNRSPGRGRRDGRPEPLRGVNERTSTTRTTPEIGANSLRPRRPHSQRTANSR